MADELVEIADALREAIERLFGAHSFAKGDRLCFDPKASGAFETFQKSGNAGLGALFSAGVKAVAERFPDCAMRQLIWHIEPMIESRPVPINYALYMRFSTHLLER